ncbi:hypothetical protein CcaverHIS002_0500790 [Cutaneotrichosporon cavernicola]|uniref:Uncharacterized protein n=1 Tax=Cutaneotrichosporon cavernicola TaxID=279322 RepID=A0AA48L817_9TREE|nr:uncharacterized protein CcaverHIS019_0600790 [Cutaneotrichosporon cavernicola]BEI84678.1 hypothetical protein CcaverHIS002_0500790 [Cutaneotrichosporon cavernicola]BEI93620.1 hypothetical protein CcaverHIS019_0600790 [Cutaneotrichosporon cavernicola]BEJ01397.1 hypothetical protein CcaverHIS631_0600790 [Cutaneotrichosporon cavernicola]BEJ09164.1 hypothetical protein CcaverHIS641_0600790 [Cutaneotrichosporon cavernicola]
MPPETDIDAIHTLWREAARSDRLTDEQRACLLDAECLNLIDPRKPAPPESPGPKAHSVAIFVTHVPVDKSSADSALSPTLALIPESPPSSPTHFATRVQPTKSHAEETKEKLRPRSLPAGPKKVQFSLPAGMRPPSPPSPTRSEPEKDDAVSRFRDRLRTGPS